MTDRPQYFSYGFKPETESEWKNLPVSTRYPPLDSNDNPWVTVPWNEFYSRPEEVDHPGPVLGKWTFLYGPCHYQATANIGLDQETRQAQAHIALYHADDLENITSRRNAWEWMIGTKEGHTVHLDGTWNGWLPEGQRLRLWVDYWHGDRPAKIIRANVSGFYWRPASVVA